MKSWRIWAGVTLLGLSLACGGDDEEETGPKGTQIDCSWFAGDNCYKQALASARSCMPAEADTGTLTAAGDRCTYTSGHSVTFKNSVNNADNNDYVWDFELSSSAGKCIGYHETSGGFRLETPSGTFTEETMGLALQLTCPDGSQFYMSNAFNALECGFDKLPGYATSSSDNSVNFSFIGTGVQATDAFTCTR
ncbi:hypothetical protein [Hyalangium gracile]|uniref:hypothetical protein n=1 Tax=Hyalangium gracile TaxID=394092 RepID=UPI001CC975F9|nr:hypothetical protein [Hyalangium gracile]